MSQKNITPRNAEQVTGAQLNNSKAKAAHRFGAEKRFSSIIVNKDSSINYSSSRADRDLGDLTKANPKLNRNGLNVRSGSVAVDDDYI